MTPDEAWRAAIAAAQGGDLPQAATLLAPHLDRFAPPRRAEALKVVGAVAAARGDHVGAVSAFSARADLLGTPDAAFDLARAFQESGAHDAALDRLLPLLGTPRLNGRWFLFAGLSLDETGRSEEAAKLWDLGAAIDPAVRTAWRHPDADAATRKASARADKSVREALSALHREASRGEARIERAAWVQTHDAPPPPRDGGAKPHLFFVPDLADQAVFAPAWLADLERRTDEIAAEFQAVRAAVTSAPYVSDGVAGPEWQSLRGHEDWSAVTLYAGGEAVQAAAFPKTAEALRGLPLTRIDGVPVEAFFSILAPGTRIPPHHGLSNARMTVHLPLEVPDGDLGIRVGAETHRWRKGRAFAFDDSHEHEAWNRSDGERIVLIFEAWRPDLSEAERAAIEASYAARQRWLGERAIPKA